LASRGISLLRGYVLNFCAHSALSIMSDAHHYFMAHAVRATLKARALPRGLIKKKQRVVARVYHMLEGGGLRTQPSSHG
jgi:hypothetical protein